jgi:hypothetical protein
MFRKIKARATLATITAVAAITVASAAPAAAATTTAGTPVAPATTQPAPNQADGTVGAGPYFWLAVKYEVLAVAEKAT